MLSIGEVAVYVIFREWFHNTVIPILPSNLLDLENNLLAAIIIATLVITNTIIAFLLESSLRFTTIVLPLKRSIRGVLQSARDWILSADVYWATTIKGKDRRIGNVVEGLMCLINTVPQLTASHQDIINEATGYLLEQTGKGGLKSITLNKYTVHCTAMGLYILNQLWKTRNYNFNSKELAKIEKLKDSLVASVSNFGWGFVNEPISSSHDVRIFSTLWALRALAGTKFVHHTKYQTIFTNLVRKIPGQRFGYTYEDEPKVCIISLFLLLAKDLFNSPLSGYVQEAVDITGLLRFLIYEVSRGRLAEVEEYKYPLKSAPEKLSWVHISGGIAIQALSLHAQYLSKWQRFQLRKIVKVVIANNRAKEGYFYEQSISFNKTDPKIFPTAYYCSGIYCYNEYVVKEHHEIRGETQK